jgi:hypothetical protein
MLNPITIRRKKCLIFFLCIAWPLIIFLTITAYRISKKKFKPVIAAIITGVTGIVAVFVSANVIGTMLIGDFRISYIFQNLIFLVLPWLVF